MRHFARFVQLYNSFVPFKKREKHPWRSHTFSKLYWKNTPQWVFSSFLNCTNGTKSRKASQRERERGKEGRGSGGGGDKSSLNFMAFVFIAFSTSLSFLPFTFFWAKILFKIQGRGWLKFRLMSSAASICSYKIIPYRVWSKLSWKTVQLIYAIVVQTG